MFQDIIQQLNLIVLFMTVWYWDGLDIQFYLI